MYLVGVGKKKSESSSLNEQKAPCKKQASGATIRFHVDSDYRRQAAGWREMGSLWAPPATETAHGGEIPEALREAGVGRKGQGRRAGFMSCCHGR